MLLNKRLGQMMVLPSLLLLLVVGLGPILFALYSSIYRQSPNPAIPIQFYGLGNLFDLLQDPQFFQSIRATGTVLLVAVPLQIVLGFILAQSLYQIPLMWRSVLTILVLIPSALAPVVVGVVWWMMLNPRFGLVNAVLIDWFGFVDKIQWQVAMPWALIGIILAIVWQWTPFVAVILLGGLASIDDELVEAALVDGASFWQRIQFITFPLLRPYFFIAGLLMVIEVTRLYEVPWYITQGGPGNETVLLGIYMFKLAFTFFDLGRANAMSVLVVLFLTIVAVLYMKTLGTKDIEQYY